MSSTPTVLTKFTKYYDSYFDLENSPKIKMSLASEFNDIFDSQVYLDPKNISELADEYRMSVDNIKFLAKRMSNCVHIVSLSAKCALDINTANMWGIYAGDGKGIALEFDYLEMEDRFNSYYMRKLIQGFDSIDKTVGFLTSLPLAQMGEETYKQRLKLVNTDDGRKGLMGLMSFFSATKLGKLTGIFDEYYNLLKQGIVCDELIYSILMFIREYKKNPNRGLLLYKVEYTEDNVSLLHESFDAVLLKERLIFDKKYSESCFPDLNKVEKQIAWFAVRKSKIWEHENEYRIISPYYFHRDYGKEGSRDLNEHIVALDKFIEMNKETNYFYQVGDIAVQDVDNIIDGSGSIALINMPLPKKIYLGWRFRENDKDFAKYNKIKRFCEAHPEIELIQLKDYFDFDTGQFSSELINTKINDC